MSSILQSVSGDPKSSMTMPKHNTHIIDVTQRGAAIPTGQNLQVRFGMSIRNGPFDSSV